MRDPLSCLVVLCGLAAALSTVACGCSSDSTTSPGPTDGAPTDGFASDGPAPGEGCRAAGGTCGCAGGCSPGTHPAARPLLDDCPQPCPTCGACSMWCCLKDDAGPTDASTDSAGGDATDGADGASDSAAADARSSD